MLSRALPARVRAREAAAAEVLRLLELASQVGPEELRRASSGTRLSWRKASG